MASGSILVTIAVSLVATILEAWINSGVYFLIRQWIFRVLELAVLVSLTVPFYRGFFEMIDIVFNGSTAQSGISMRALSIGVQ